MEKLTPIELFDQIEIAIKSNPDTYTAIVSHAAISFAEYRSGLEKKEHNIMLAATLLSRANDGKLGKEILSKLNKAYLDPVVIWVLEGKKLCDYTS
ncbi:MAG: hypothetical protein CMI54_00415 [Parcubacteria group bacterium]|nr:hypothetical protein [Parcubacteria group bacterium]|tara:strand:- start:187 stop:474 length:288 start_codon:yes stop_codon:yes gene_type:complete